MNKNKNVKNLTKMLVRDFKMSEEHADAISNLTVILEKSKNKKKNKIFN